jgi:hypothetical protein
LGGQLLRPRLRFLQEAAPFNREGNVRGCFYPSAVYSRLPGRGAVILVTDSGMLMGEVMQSSRNPDGSPGGRITSLMWALHRGGAVLIVPRHVLAEVERDLPRRATATDDVELAYRRL